MTWQGTCIRKSWFWNVFGMRSHCFSFCRLYHSNVNSWIKLVEDIDKHAVAEFNTIGITLSVEVFLSKAWVLAFVILWCAKWVKSVLIGVFEILQVTFESTSPQEGAFFLDQIDGDWRKPIYLDRATHCNWKSGGNVPTTSRGAEDLIRLRSVGSQCNERYFELKFSFGKICYCWS